MHALPDHYAVLGLAPDASPDMVKRRFRDLARRYHPDLDASAEAAERIRELTAAYDVLSDLAKRTEYDVARCSRMWGAVTLVNRSSEAELDASLRYWQFHVFGLDGGRIRDASSLFTAANRELPHLAGLQIDSWNSLDDALWETFADMAECRSIRRVAILWTAAHNMLKAGLPDLLTAIDCFRGLAGHVATTEHGFPCPMVLRTFLIGEGPNFPRWQP